MRYQKNKESIHHKRNLYRGYVEKQRSVSRLVYELDSQRYLKEEADQAQKKNSRGEKEEDP